MPIKRNLRRIQLQSGATDRMRRPLEGLFEVLLDNDDIVEQMEKAVRNKSRMCTRGSAIVIYHPCTKAQADYLVAHPDLVQPMKRPEVACPACGAPDCEAGRHVTWKD